jgi:hypothetical protein
MVLLLLLSLLILTDGKLEVGGLRVSSGGEHAFSVCFVFVSTNQARQVGGIASTRN